MGSFPICVLLLLTLSFSTGRAQTKHPLMPVYQALVTLTNQSDCWLCQQLDSAKEPELVFVPADMNTWWTKYGKWMNNRV